MNENILYDMVIVGCGPAGLSAAVNAKIRKKNIKLIGGEVCSPKLYSSPEINNYLGFPNIKGSELKEHFLNHIKSLGIDIVKNTVVNIFQGDGSFDILTRDNEIYKARSVIIAVGVTNDAVLPGEEEFLGRGVSYCATCDAPLYRGKNVAVVSFEEEGEKEAKLLSQYSSRVYYIPRYNDAPKFIADNVEIINDIPTAVIGDKFVTSLELSKGRIEVQGVFIIRETVPVDKLIPGLEMVDDRFIKVNLNMETNIPGVFAAGDCVGKPFQLAKAVGQGQIAALTAADYLEQLNARR
ncbi:MAG TPA: thioredoxin reductase [Peptococcaceae bacterium]|nr:MAG: FAD-dependent pyridine nucleotide-disulfide oxidoreductase [Clostridia bacterium 41_269]HBT20129.1 thioredoxin reductase [Peptococcaceae bacterium]